MPKYDHHICFVSSQNVAEFLGTRLQEIGSSNLHAIATSAMEKQADYLKKTCQKNGIKCSLYRLQQIGITEIHALLDSIWFSQPESSWALNITGGTKIMSLAAYTWGAKNNIDMFYIDTASKTALVYKQDSWQSPIHVPPIINFEPLLNLYGYEIESQIKAPVPAAVRNATERLVEIASQTKNIRALSALNEKAMTASHASDLTVSYYPDSGFTEVLEICKSAGKLDYTDSIISFTDEASRKWCNGIWLEEFVQATLSRLESEGRIYSWASSVNIIGEKVKNELDAIFTANNCLYVLECKTSKMNSQEQSTASILYKADSLRDRVGGIFTKSMLCSLHDLPPGDKQRAQNMNLRTIIGPNIKQLRKKIIEWIEAK